MLKLGGPTKLRRLNKLHAYKDFLSPHHAAGAARPITIKDKFKGSWDWTVNLYLGPHFRQIPNDTFNGKASGPLNLGTFQRPHSRDSMAGANRPAIFDDNRALDDRTEYAIGWCFHVHDVGELKGPVIGKNNRIATDSAPLAF